MAMATVILSTRLQVLNLYRRILRAAHSWKATDASQTKIEKAYIVSEAKEIFKRNKFLIDEYAIKQRILEGEARLEMALHYNCPYPRPVNLPPMTLASAVGKSNKRRKQISRPVYIKSIDN